MRIPYDVPVAVGRQFVALSSDVAAAILLTLEAGWNHALSFSDVHTGATEVPITERLRDGMRLVLQERLFAWSKTMIISPGTESRSRPDVLRPDGRTDIPIYLIEIFLTLGEHDPHAIIECKRIAGSDSHLCREYVIEGIDRFRVGKYAENHSAGFMAGYVLSGDALNAAVGVNNYLTGKMRKADHLAQPGALAQPWVWRSSHLRASPSKPIELHHAFLKLPAQTH